VLNNEQILAAMEQDEEDESEEDGEESDEFSMAGDTSLLRHVAQEELNRLAGLQQRQAATGDQEQRAKAKEPVNSGIIKLNC